MCSRMRSHSFVSSSLLCLSLLRERGSKRGTEAALSAASVKVQLSEATQELLDGAGVRPELLCAPVCSRAVRPAGPGRIHRGNRGGRRGKRPGAGSLSGGIRAELALETDQPSVPGGPEGREPPRGQQLSLIRSPPNDY